jgi:uncharacterized protein YqgC (DUF456 family)
MREGFMEYILLTVGLLLMIIGLIGAFLPVAPGLPFSYGGLLILQFLYTPFSLIFLIVWALIVVLVGFVLDNVIPAWSTKKFGGSAYGVTGSIIGLIAGLFFPPLGLVVGPLAGAFIGELIAGNTSDKAIKSALGAFVGFLASTGLKVMAAAMMAYYFISGAFL